MAIKKVTDFCRGRKEHLLNFGSFFVNRLFSLALFAFTTSIFINRAGNESYGVLTMLLLIYNYISVADMGMGYAVGLRLTRALSRRNEAYARRILQRAFPFYIVVGLLSSLAVFCFSAELSRIFTRSTEYSYIYKVIAMSIFPLILDSVVLIVLQAFNRVYLINASRLLYDIFRALPLLLVIVIKRDFLDWIMTAIAVGCYLKLFADIYLASRLLGGLSWIRPAFFPRELSFNIRFGVPMLLTLAIGMIITSLDKFYITNFMTMEQLAYYSLALEVNVKAWFLIWAVTGSLYTVLIRRNVTNRSSDDLQRISLYAVVAIFLFYYLPLMIFAKQILSLWINPDFAEKSYRITRILCFASLFYMVYSVKHNTLQAAGRFVTITGIYAIGLGLLLAGLFVLPRYFGVDGVAYSYVFTYGAFVVMALVCMRKVRSANA